MAASEKRSSARVAPRSVMRLAAISSMTSATLLASDATAPVQRRVADGAIANRLAPRPVSCGRGLHPLVHGERTCRLARRPHARARSRSTATRAPRARCSATRRARSSRRSGRPARARPGRTRPLYRCHSSGRWLRGSHWPNSSRNDRMRSLARALSSSRRAPPKHGVETVARRWRRAASRTAGGCGMRPSRDRRTRPASIDCCTDATTRRAPSSATRRVAERRAPRGSCGRCRRASRGTGSGRARNAFAARWSTTTESLPPENSTTGLRSSAATSRMMKIACDFERVEVVSALGGRRGRSSG